MPTFGSLFSGIDGLGLGLAWTGWTPVWQVEFDPASKAADGEQFNQRVLAARWPGLQRFGDVRAVDFTAVPKVDLIVGGFPCQPVSIAGKRRAQDDPRWLWPEFARAIRDVGPRLVLVENVPGLLRAGRAGAGPVDDAADYAHGPMGDVLGGLADLGYDAEWEVLSAADVGAPHLRRRVWIRAWQRAGA